MRRAALLVSSVLAAPAIFAAPASAVEPTRGPDPRIAVWRYNKMQSLDVTSVDCKQVNIVLEPGETVLTTTAAGVFADWDTAEGKGGWHMPMNAFRDRQGDADKKGEPKPELVRDQITLQPAKCDAGPVVLQLMTFFSTEGREGDRYPYVLVLHAVKGADAAKGKEPYQQIQVQRPPKPDPVAVAAASTARRARAEEWRQRQIEARLTAAPMVQAAAGPAVGVVPAAARPGDWDIVSGSSSPDACDLLRPVLTPEIRAGRTVLTFDPRTPAAQVYTMSKDGSEPTLVRPTPGLRADGWTTYTLPGTYARVILVDNRQVCILRYNGYNRAPEPNLTGTASAEVRVVPR